MKEILVVMIKKIFENLSSIFNKVMKVELQSIFNVVVFNSQMFSPRVEDICILNIYLIFE